MPRRYSQIIFLALLKSKLLCFLLNFGSAVPTLASSSLSTSTTLARLAGGIWIAIRLPFLERLFQLSTLLLELLDARTQTHPTALHSDDFLPPPMAIGRSSCLAGLKSDKASGIMTAS